MRLLPICLVVSSLVATAFAARVEARGTAELTRMEVAVGLAMDERLEVLVRAATIGRSIVFSGKRGSVDVVLTLQPAGSDAFASRSHCFQVVTTTVRRARGAPVTPVGIEISADGAVLVNGQEADAIDPCLGGAGRLVLGVGTPVEVGEEAPRSTRAGIVQSYAIVGPDGRTRASHAVDNDTRYDWVLMDFGT